MACNFTNNLDMSNQAHGILYKWLAAFVKEGCTDSEYTAIEQRFKSALFLFAKCQGKHVEQVSSSIEWSTEVDNIIQATQDKNDIWQQEVVQDKIAAIEIRKRMESEVGSFHGVKLCIHIPPTHAGEGVLKIEDEVFLTHDAMQEYNRQKVSVGEQHAQRLLLSQALTMLQEFEIGRSGTH